MTSAKQVQANRENAKKSTGPRTTEGKQRTALNAIKHGFRAKDPLIPGEDPDEFHRHGADLLVELAPITVVEQNLVDQIIDITWRLKRFPRIEAAVINELYDSAAGHPFNQEKDSEQLLGKALARDQALNRLSRYEAQLARRYHNVMKELRELRKQRRERVSLSALAAGDKAQANEPTHFDPSYLESTVPTNTSDRGSDPSRPDVAEVHPPHPQNPAQPGIRRPPPSSNPTSPPRTTPPSTAVQPTCAQYSLRALRYLAPLRETPFQRAYQERKPPSSTRAWPFM